MFRGFIEPLVEVDEDAGSVEVCAELLLEVQRSFEVMLSTSDMLAQGMVVLWSLTIVYNDILA